LTRPWLALLIVVAAGVQAASATEPTVIVLS